MGFWGVVSRFLPRFWKGVRDRNEIKSIHIENIRRLENEQPVRCDFDDFEEALLGELASKTHFEAKSKIRSAGSKKTNGYSIHKRADRTDIKSLSRSTIRRIRLKNGLSIAFWIIFILMMIAVVGFVASHFNIL